VEAALDSGLIPKFMDVDLTTGASRGWQAEAPDQVAAVLLVHLYGNIQDATSLRGWCDRHGITLIEDAAHALGGKFPSGKPVGSLGDMTVFSLSGAKILEGSPAGGILLSRAPIEKSILRLPEESKAQLPASMVPPVHRALYALGHLGARKNIPLFYSDFRTHLKGGFYSWEYDVRFMIKLFKEVPGPFFPVGRRAAFAGVTACCGIRLLSTSRSPNLCENAD
jgi:hypothetical protein